MEEQKPNNVIELNPNKDIKNKGEDEMVLKMMMQSFGVPVSQYQKFFLSLRQR